MNSNLNILFISDLESDLGPRMRGNQGLIHTHYFKQEPSEMLHFTYIAVTLTLFGSIPKPDQFIFSL